MVATMEKTATESALNDATNTEVFHKNIKVGEGVTADDVRQIIAFETIGFKNLNAEQAKNWQRIHDANNKNVRRGKAKSMKGFANFAALSIAKDENGKLVNPAANLGRMIGNTLLNSHGLTRDSDKSLKTNASSALAYISKLASGDKEMLDEAVKYARDYVDSVGEIADTPMASHALIITGVKVSKGSQLNEAFRGVSELADTL